MEQGLISPLSFPELIRITKPGGFILWNIATGYQHYGKDYERFDNHNSQKKQNNIHSIQVQRLCSDYKKHQSLFSFSQHDNFLFDRYDDIIMELVRERRFLAFSCHYIRSHIFTFSWKISFVFKSTPVIVLSLSQMEFCCAVEKTFQNGIHRWA